MSELTDVLSAIESLSARGSKLALATIVAVSGSTYARPGARLLVPRKASSSGTSRAVAWRTTSPDVAKVVMTRGVARIVSFDLTADDDAVWGWGLGCNGAFELFVEPADKAAEVAGALRMALEEERPISMVTVLDADVPGVEQGNRMLVKPDGVETVARRRRARPGRAQPPPRAPRGRTQRGAHPLRLERRGARLRRGARAAAAAADLRRRARCRAAGRGGGGPGWNPIVVDDRPEFLSRERFPRPRTSCSSSVRTRSPRSPRSTRARTSW
jgi:xanthine/CO dehydrogenase XdhC/CoxF family maturation factor